MRAIGVDEVTRKPAIEIKTSQVAQGRGSWTHPGDCLRSVGAGFTPETPAKTSRQWPGWYSLGLLAIEVCARVPGAADHYSLAQWTFSDGYASTGSPSIEVDSFPSTPTGTSPRNVIR